MDLIKWLLKGDVSIKYITSRDLLNIDDKSLKSRISEVGWGKDYLNLQKTDYHWGNGFYQAKWTSTHYTLLELRNLDMNPCKNISTSIDIILDKCRAEDGGISPSNFKRGSDVCINGMALNYMCHFKTAQDKLIKVIDYLLLQQLPDGGFNCSYNTRGATHSSLHSTLSVLEGIESYYQNGYTYRLNELLKMKKEAIEFILIHRLYKSDKTGKVIKNSFKMLSYPTRWYYDILKALDYFCYASIPYDERMEDAIELLISKRKADGTWPVQAKHPGVVFFDMEQTGKSSRWNTLRALRVLKHFKPEYLTD